ncbi:MAG: glycoside hydrolase family 78 protein [Bacteroidales bacterium]|nr:glycoside hydrolase family 78 protein [Bacteroidales bacterium]
MKPIHLLTLAVLLAATACGNADITAGKRTEALDSSLWDQSSWISARDAEVVTGPVKNDENHLAADGASWFLSTVANDSKVVSAKWMTAGLGIYDIYVNGKLIGNEILKPGFTHPFKTKLSFTYDITDAVRTGKGEENVFAAQVTPGWWADKIVTPGDTEGMRGHKCAFRSVLEFEYADGSVRTFGTDTLNWKAGTAGPVKHAGIFDGERYDARETMGFDCPDALGTPEINDEFQGEILPSKGAEVYYREDLALNPVKAYIWNGIEGEGEEEYGKVTIKCEFAEGETITLNEGETLVVDFGQNCAGVPEFTFEAAGGTVLTCLPAEMLNDGNGAHIRGMDGPEGSVYRKNLRFADGISLTYTFAGKGRKEHFRPRCTFFGYRYISVTATDKVVIRSVRSIPVTSIAQSLETGVLTTGDKDINRLISNSVWGQRSNYLSVPTDCPQRNERLGWTADTQVFAETGTFFANTDRFFHKWMRDMRDSRNEAGSFPGVAPTAQYGREMSRLGWADAGIIVPWTIWKQFGDREIVDENWEAMDKFLGYLTANKYDHNALIADNGNYQWADWLSYEPLEAQTGRAFYRLPNGKRAPLPEAVEYWNFLSASYWASDATMMAQMAASTGRDAARYEAIAGQAKDYIRETFFNSDGSFKVDILNTMQTPALFTLSNGIFEGEAREAVIARLKDNFAAHNGLLQTGFLGTSIIMKTLTDNGMVDIAYDLLFQHGNPSWLYSVDNGATTMWERWNSYTREEGMGPKGMNSFNHYAYGCVCAWLWETAAGINADVKAPGFSHIILKPVPDRRLGWLKSEFKSASGLIRSEWKYEGDSWTWEFSIPEGTIANVILPDGSAPAEYEAGDYKLTLDNVR